MRHVLSILLILVLGVVFSENLHAEGTWTSYININQVKDIGVHGNTIWALTDGGVVEWDIATLTHRIHKEFGPYCRVLGVDQEGNLWVNSSIDGLMRYNGSSVRKFTDKDGLYTNSINSFSFDEGSFLIGNENDGFFLFDSTIGVGFLSLAEPLQSLPYETIAPDGSIWACVNNTLYHAVGQKCINYDIPRSFYARAFDCIAVDSTGCVWTGSNGAFRFNGTYWEEIITNNVTDIAVGQDSTVWIATDSGIFSYKNGKTLQMTVDNGLPDNKINAITVGLDGTVWFGTEKGIAGYKNGNWTIVADDCWLPDNAILYMDVDRKGVVWYHSRTFPTPVYAFDATSWMPYSKENIGFKLEFTQIIESDNRGDIWCYIPQELEINWCLAKYDGEKWTTIQLQRGNEVLSCDYDSKGILWVTEESFESNGGVGCYNGDSYRRYTQADGLPYNDAQKLAISQNDDIWVTTPPSGICRFNGSEWKNFTTKDGLGGNEVSSVVISADNIVWVGAGNGTVSRFDGSSWVSWQLTEIYDYDHNYFHPITSIAVAHNGEVWAASTSGVYRFKDNSWIHYTVDDGLSSDSVLKVAVSPTGEIWFATDCGLTKYTPETSTFAAESAPEKFSLISGNYPNPFNANTTIEFKTVSDNPVTLTVYSLTGQIVRTLMNSRLEPGNHAVPWEGRDDSGQPVSSGVYVARLTADGNQTTHRMLLLK